jgi:anti-sigma factor RsiW
MNCADAKNLLHAYLDKQLDAANSLQFEQHIKTCPHCNSEYQGYLQLQHTIQNNIKPYAAPEHLLPLILNKISDEPPNHASTGFDKIRIFKYGSALAASLLIAFFAIFQIFEHSQEDKLIDEILLGHIKAIKTDRFTDIKSSETQRITTWFTGKLDYAPKVFSFPKQGFKLAGGRLDVLHDQHIAAVTYKIDHSLIDVYTWPSPDVDDADQETHDKQGYHILYWCHNHMNYWIVSNSNSKQVNQLAKLIQQQLDLEKNPAN